MYKFTVKLKPIKEVTFFVLYYETSADYNDMNYFSFSASSNAEFSQRLKEVLEKEIPSDATNLMLYQNVDFSVIEVDRSFSIDIYWYLFSI